MPVDSDDIDAAKPGALRRFARVHGLSTGALCVQIVAAEDSGISVRNPKVAAANLARIVDATLRLANRKGFAAMTLRELATASGLSPGALYAYIVSKDELARLIQHRISLTLRALMTRVLADVEGARARLATAIRAHLLATEALREWFFFLYMEAHHLAAGERRQAIANEQASEAIFADIIRAGQREGVYHDTDAAVAAGLLKALLQDWYLKRGKHLERGLDVHIYADTVIHAIEAHLSKPATPKECA